MSLISGMLIGIALGILIPVILGIISHLQHKRESPGQPDTHSGAASYLLIITVPVGAVVGLIFSF